MEDVERELGIEEPRGEDVRQLVKDTEADVGCERAKGLLPRCRRRRYRRHHRSQQANEVKDTSSW